MNQIRSRRVESTVEAEGIVGTESTGVGVIGTESEAGGIVGIVGTKSIGAGVLVGTKLEAGGIVRNQQVQET
jgi:hypothetical protein